MALPPSPIGHVAEHSGPQEDRTKVLWPFQVIAGVNNMAYQLKLSVGVELHDVFNVVLLKIYCGDEPPGPDTLPPFCHGHACL
jgi:hypothetical protein